MEVLTKTPEKLVLRTSIGYPLANAIRRSVEEIPALAIDEVEIFKNDSALYDEVLAHRLGLIPLKTDSKMNEKTSIDLTIKKKGPGKVYSGDLEGGAKIIYDNIPITLLEDKQEIEVICTARLGKGTEHAKYVPGLVYYRHLTEIKSGNSHIDKIVENSKGLIKPEKKGSKWICDLNESEIDDIKKIGEDNIKDSEEILIFVESFGHMDAEKIILAAVERLEDNLIDFEKNIK